MSILMAIFLGLVQGITEFLPVSSSGHLSIIQNLFSLNYEEADHLFFDVLLHLGTLISVIIVYRKEIKEMLTDGLAFISGKQKTTEVQTTYGSTESNRFTPAVRLLFFIIVGTLPLFVILPFNGAIEGLFYNTPFIAFALLITGGLLFVSEKIVEGRKNEKTMTVADAVIIGISQAIAIIPGLSRSGTTITVGISRGLKRDFAVKFSFLLSLPAVIGSILLSLIKAFSAGINWGLIPVYLVGVVVAAVSGYFAIRLVKMLIDKTRFGKMSYYCWAVGLLTLLLSAIL